MPEIDEVTPLVERLRKRADVACRECRFGDEQVMREAADEIAQLRRRIEEMKPLTMPVWPR